MAYMFKKHDPQLVLPILTLAETRSSVQIEDVLFQPIPLWHGSMLNYGWRFGKTAYLTDTNNIPQSSYELLQGVEIVIIDGLSPNFHSTHFSFDDAMEAIAKIQPKRAFLTHFDHVCTHIQILDYIHHHQIKSKLLSNIDIQPAYDRLIIDLP